MIISNYRFSQQMDALMANDKKYTIRKSNSNPFDQPPGTLSLDKSTSSNQNHQSERVSS